MAFSRKELRERHVADLLGAYLNQNTGTDYALAPDTPPEPADVRLLSRSRSHAYMDIQVVSCPAEGGQGRNSHGNTDRLCSQLAKQLTAAGIVDIVVNVHTQDSVFTRGVPQEHIALLAQMILELRPPDGARHHVEEISDGELFLVNPDLIDSITHVSMYFNSGHEEPFISVPLAIWQPEDDRLIQEAIALKRAGKNYDAKAMKGIVLLIDAHWSIDNQQIAAYREMLAPGLPDFKEIWILGAFASPTRLKP